MAQYTFLPQEYCETIGEIKEISRFPFLDS